MNKNATMGSVNNYYDVVVFGGSSGIGLASSIAFKDQGLKVLVLSRNAENNHELKTHGIDGKDFDIFNSDALQHLFSELKTKHIVLSTSMPLQFEMVRDINLAQAKTSFEKVWAYLSIIKYAANKLLMLESITLVSGAIAKNNVPGTVSLKLMASSLNEMGKTLAVELAPIRVNVVSPGITDTPLYNEFANKNKMLQDMASALPLKRIAQPAEIANAILFATLSKNVTGAVIDIDGGASL